MPRSATRLVLLAQPIRWFSGTLSHSGFPTGTSSRFALSSIRESFPSRLSPISSSWTSTTQPAKLETAYGLMTVIQTIGLAGFNLLIGWANDHSYASAANPAGYRMGMWIFSILGFLAVLFAFLLRQRELGPHGHGLETITAKA